MHNNSRSYWVESLIKWRFKLVSASIFPFDHLNLSWARIILIYMFLYSGCSGYPGAIHGRSGTLKGLYFRLIALIWYFRGDSLDLGSPLLLLDIKTQCFLAVLNRIFNRFEHTIYKIELILIKAQKLLFRVFELIAFLNIVNSFLH